MARQPRICVIGSLNVDFVTSTPRVPGPGETLTATSLTIHPGGKGANQAAACGKAAFTSPGSQDVTVEMIGAVGANDPNYAALLKPALQKSGVNTAGIEEIRDEQTGTATILVDEGSNGENRIMFVPGANARVTDVDQILKTACKEAFPDVVVLQGEVPRSTTVDILHFFNSSERDSCVVFNPAPMFPDGIPLSALVNLSVLVVNETECRQLFSSVTELQSTKVSGTEEEALAHEELVQLAQTLHQVAKITLVIITLGSRGVFFSDNTSNEASKDSFLMPAAKVERVVDTTAAGDTFVGYFATALARHTAGMHSLSGFDVQQAVSTANKAAAQCVQRSGAMGSIPFGYEREMQD